MLFKKNYIKFSDAEEAIRNYIVQTKKLLKIIPGRQFEIIGHRAGSYQEYPFDLGSLDNTEDISKLMELSFERLNLTGVEIDVRTITGCTVPECDKPEIKNQVFVVHNRINTGLLSKKTFDYMKKNSLEKVLSDFITKEYCKKEKKIYIELKIPSSRFHKNHPKIDPDTKILIDRTHAIIKKITKRHDSNPARRSIAIISFSFFALEEIKNILGNDYRYYLIAATNRLFPRVLNFLMEGLPVFNSFVIDKLEKTDWLTGVWFDPKWVSGYSGIFNKINEKRVKAKKNMLEIFVSTYGLSYDKYKESLADNTVLKNVAGIIVEICRSEKFN